MKSRKSILSGVLILMAAVLIVCCATKPYVPTEDEPLYGIWANEEYTEGGIIIYYPDGKGLGHMKTADPEPQWECRFTIEAKWTDREGNIYYRIAERWLRRPYEERLAFPWKVSVKIHPSGDVMESIASQYNYYEEVKPGNYWYRIHYRQ